jgi:LSD1 subclass zinc finger protein
VPATSERFTCGHCANQNKCSPLYRIFLCGTCNAKVLYTTGSSDLIKCTRCSAVNKVPLAHGNPYEVQYRVASLDRDERETDPFREDCLEISELGVE